MLWRTNCLVGVWSANVVTTRALAGMIWFLEHRGLRTVLDAGNAFSLIRSWCEHSIKHLLPGLFLYQRMLRLLTRCSPSFVAATSLSISFSPYGYMFLLRESAVLFHVPVLSWQVFSEHAFTTPNHLVVVPISCNMRPLYISVTDNLKKKIKRAIKLKQASKHY